MKTHQLEIEGMSCQHCVKSVRDALLRVPGVIRADVTIGKAEVEAQDDVSKAVLVTALAAADYVAS